MKSEILSIDQIILRDTCEQDLPVLFEHQVNEEANYLAAFTVKDPLDREAFLIKWNNVLLDNSIVMKTIVLDEQIMGSVLVYMMGNEPQLSYWIGNSFWGMGVATKAVTLFLNEYSNRPLFAGAAADNFGSIQVLNKHDFKAVGRERGFANARDAEIDELVFKLD